MKLKDEDGQALVIAVLAMSLFLLGALGLAVDGAHMYAQRQMAQTAADAAAQAGIMSIFDNTYGAGPASFTTTSSFACTTTDARTPCSYASKNGFGSSTSDTVTVDFPPASAAPGVNLFVDPDPTKPSLIRVTVQRTVNTTLMALLGPTSSTVKATAMAAILSVVSPTPILVTDPKNPGTFTGNGSTTIKICGGPTRSIQVNSSDSGAFTGGFANVDLSNAGPADSGDCTKGTGADFGIFGGSATNPGDVSLGSTGRYMAPASPIQDPLAFVDPPTTTGRPIGTFKSILNGVDGCINPTGCTEYSPGLWAGGIDTKLKTVIFKPGVYYIQGGGFNMKNSKGGAAGNSVMCSGCPADPETGTGLLIYDTGPAGSTTGNNPTGGFTIDTNVSALFQGPNLTTHVAQGQHGCTDSLGCDIPKGPYYDITFWEDRTADPHTHIIGKGNGCFQIIGTMYTTNTQAIMTNTSDTLYPNHVQQISYNGTPCSTTTNQGDIITGQLHMVGISAIKMKLVPYSYLQVRQVALVN